LWGLDPVHPIKEGYMRIADLICEAVVKLGCETGSTGSVQEASLGLLGRSREWRSPDRGVWRRIPQPQWFTEAVNMAVEPAEDVGSRLAVGLQAHETEQLLNPCIVIYCNIFVIEKNIKTG